MRRLDAGSSSEIVSASISPSGPATGVTLSYFRRWIRPRSASFVLAEGERRDRMPARGRGSERSGHRPSATGRWPGGRRTRCIAAHAPDGSRPGIRRRQEFARCWLREYGRDGNRKERERKKYFAGGFQEPQQTLHVVGRAVSRRFRFSVSRLLKTTSNRPVGRSSLRRYRTHVAGAEEPKSRLKAPRRNQYMCSGIRAQCRFRFQPAKDSSRFHRSADGQSVIRQSSLCTARPSTARPTIFPGAPAANRQTETSL